MPFTLRHPSPPAGPSGQGGTESASAAIRIADVLPKKGNLRKRARRTIGFISRFCLWFGSGTIFTRDLLVAALICSPYSEYSGNADGGAAGSPNAEKLPSEVLHPLLKNVSGLGRVALLVSEYRARWDGTGIPAGLGGEALELGTRIIHVAEAFSHIVGSLPPDISDLGEGLQRLEAMGGSGLDPELTANFIAMVKDQWKDSTAAQTDDESLAPESFIDEIITLAKNLLSGRPGLYQTAEGLHGPGISPRRPQGQLDPGLGSGPGGMEQGRTLRESAMHLGPDVTDFLDCLLQSLWRTTGYRCWISLTTKEGYSGVAHGNLHLAAVKGLSSRSVGLPVLSDCIDEKVLEAGEPMVHCIDLEGAEGGAEGGPVWGDRLPPGQSWIHAIPITGGNIPLGVLSLAAPQKQLPPSEEKFVHLLAHLAGSSVHRVRLQASLDQAMQVSRLQQMKARLLEKKRQGMLVIDSQSRIEYVNSQAEEIISWIGTRRPRPGLLFRELEDVLGLADEVVSILRMGGPETEISGRAVVRGRHRRIFDTSVFPVVGAKGAVEGAVVGIRDVTHRHKLEEHLMHNQGFVTLGQMAAGTVHEIRNPLTAIKGLLQLLHEDSDPASAQLELAIDEVGRVEALVEDLLVLGKPLKLDMKLQDINAEVSQAAALLEGQAKKCGCHIELDLAPGMLKAGFDSSKMRQVLYNLGQNGLAAMAKAEGSKVLTLSTRLDVSKSRVVIGVADTGEGMSAETKDSIFDPFFTTRPRGLGLGLTVSLRIIEAHRGDMLVHTDPGWGTLIHIYLPTKLNPTKI